MPPTVSVLLIAAKDWSKPFRSRMPPSSERAAAVEAVFGDVQEAEAAVDAAADAGRHSG